MKTEHDVLGEKLDTLIQLASLALAQDKAQKEQIRLLSLAGLSGTRIAQILGTTANTVKVTLAKMRKAKKLRNQK